jgi:archaellum component FlaC
MEDRCTCSQESRLERIENKIDTVVDAVHNIQTDVAVLKTKMEGHEKTEEEVSQLKDRVDKVELKLTFRNTIIIFLTALVPSLFIIYKIVEK